MGSHVGGELQKSAAVFFYFREEVESILITRTPGKLLCLYPSLPHGQAGVWVGREGGSGRKLRGSSQSFGGAPETRSFSWSQGRKHPLVECQRCSGSSWTGCTLEATGRHQAWSALRSWGPSKYSPDVRPGQVFRAQDGQGQGTHHSSRNQS